MRPASEAGEASQLSLLAYRDALAHSSDSKGQVGSHDYWSTIIAHLCMSIANGKQAIVFDQVFFFHLKAYANGKSL